jgi:hypothetical protein
MKVIRNKSSSTTSAQINILSFFQYIQELIMVDKQHTANLLIDDEYKCSNKEARNTSL